MSDAPVFTVSVEAYYDLTVGEIWPNGDAPDNPTVNDVIAVMHAEGGQHSLMSTWGLDDDLVVTVDGVEVTW